MTPTQDQINKWLHEAGSVAGNGDLLMISQETLQRFAELAMAEQAEFDAKLCEFRIVSAGQLMLAAAIRSNAPKPVPQKPVSIEPNEA